MDHGKPHTDSFATGEHVASNPMMTECFDFRRGVEAFEYADFRVAARLLLPVASLGRKHRCDASQYVARLYARGLGGLPRDAGKARYWSLVAGRSPSPAWQRLPARLIGRLGSALDPRVPAI